jgi:hypothetical protein
MQIFFSDAVDQYHSFPIEIKYVRENRPLLPYRKKQMPYLRIPRTVNLNKCSSAKAAMVVDRRDPESSGGGGLGRFILVLLAVRSYPVNEQPARCWRHAKINHQNKPK